MLCEPSSETRHCAIMGKVNVFAGILVTVILAFSAVSANKDEKCKTVKCPGPTQYYKELNCKPIYKNEGDCCPEKYNCDHISTRDTEKCHLNGKVYNIGEQLKEEDRNPCDIGCTCRKQQSVAGFTCAVVDCPEHLGAIGRRPGCFLRHSADLCCAEKEICPEPGKKLERATCEVDGKTYMDGEPFTPKNEPTKTCYCRPGYKGENVSPFCRELRNGCGTELRHADSIHDKCLPSYYPDQDPSTSCNVAFRCQNPKDEVIRKSKGPADPNLQCTFGNLKMQIGDELNQATHYDSVCVKCVCEVPPFATCQRLPYDECDSANHPKFD